VTLFLKNKKNPRRRRKDNSHHPSNLSRAPHSLKEKQRPPGLYLELSLHMFVNPQGTMDAENYSFVTFVWLPKRKND